MHSAFGPLMLALAAASLAAESARRAEILWDTYGVPHIFAKDNEGLYYAFGWAQAHSHGNLVLELYGRSRGRGAEYFGEKRLEENRWIVVNGIPERARQWYGAQTPDFRKYLDAFAAGINDYASRHADRIDPGVKAVLPVTGIDLMAHTQYIIHFFFVTRPIPPAVLTQMTQPPTGSNAWAIGPKRSAGGKAMLLANPHLSWSDFFLFYEAHLAAPGVNLYGASLIGFPGLGIAYNDHLGWTHTVNTNDSADHYQLTLAEGGYRFDGAIKPFETETKILKVKQADGGMRDEKLVVRRSVHGPVIHESGGQAIALRVNGLDQPALLDQWWRMGRAHNLKEFEAELQRLQIPMFTVMYADRDGHIMHLFNGRVPVRPAGSYNWARVVPGDTSATLWTRTHPYSELPKAIDPPSGWLQNANDPPWTTTFPPVLDPAKFPAYLAPRMMAFRPQRSARMLDEDASVSFEEMIRYKHSSRMEMADRILDDLLPAARQHGGAIASRAAAVLEAWDRSADADSRGAVLFLAFAQEWQRRSRGKMFATPWSESSPRTTPDGLADPKGAVDALEAAAAQVERDHQKLDVAWGEVHRFAIDDVDLPANGGPDALGIFRNIGFAPMGGNRFRATGGDSFVMAVEFSNPPRAMTILNYGNASQPGSPHRTDQLPLAARKEMKPVWRTRAEIEAHLKLKESL